MMDIFNDVDDKLFVFESLYIDIVNENVPLKRVHPVYDKTIEARDALYRVYQTKIYSWKIFAKLTKAFSYTKKVNTLWYT